MAYENFKKRVGYVFIFLDGWILLIITRNRNSEMGWIPIKLIQIQLNQI